MDRVERADAAARYQVNHCKLRHGPGCLLETCNLALQWIALRKEKSVIHHYNLALEESAMRLEEQGANPKWAAMIRALRKSVPAR